MSNLGVMLMWDKRVVEKLDCTIGVSCLFRSVEDGFDWVLSGMYAQMTIRKRDNLWVELKEGMNRWEVPWYVAGDFNVVCSQILSIKKIKFIFHQRRFFYVV